MNRFNLVYTENDEGDLIDAVLEPAMHGEYVKFADYEAARQEVWDEVIRTAKDIPTTYMVEDFSNQREPRDVKSDIVKALEAKRDKALNTQQGAKANE